ncbi:hypothetical protein KXD93_18555 [Mucilaginibacter sp. BJC16-A38]|uniref:hypothetical protein n=1 Tax=Mucilaginibacter phenanthrenivorans TaxID=1234842 RepID=UPI0021570354|nr:hypothetical protein [Mucilaginibacter phenanthrenivorans]MCR8559664.1 hypothetical protein [Mucilaginibacter phenanthrenivorans]
MENLEKQVKILKIYAIVLTLVVIGFIAYSISLNSGHYKEITAERINIVEKTGRLRMVISNKERQHPGRMDDKDLPTRDRPAGMIFFNDDGDEDGGLVYDGNKNGASMTYSFDQYKNDQIMQLQYDQEKDQGKMVRSYGLNMWDRKDEFTLSKQLAYYDSLQKLNDTVAFKAGIAKLKAAGNTHQRLFVGKNTKGEVGLFLNDANGKPRLNIYINKDNQPVIETLNEKGEVVK